MLGTGGAPSCSHKEVYDKMVKFIKTDEPFVELGDNVIVALGMENRVPGTQTQKKLQNIITTEINRAAGLENRRPSVALSVKGDLEPIDRDVFGREAKHIQQYDFDIGDRKIDGALVDGIHNHLVDRLRAEGYRITETETTIS